MSVLKVIICLVLIRWHDICYSKNVLYVYLCVCVTHCTATTCGKNSIWINTSNLQKKIHYVVIISLTACIHQEKERYNEITLLYFSQAESISHWIQQNTDYLPDHEIWFYMFYEQICDLYPKAHLSIFNIIILTKRNGKCSDVLKCSKSVTKPVHHTAFITTLIYFK